MMLDPQGNHGMEMETQNGRQELLIEPNRQALHYWRDVWEYRELFWFLTLRDILVRYKQTAIGVAWSVIRPLVTMVVFSIIFGMFAKLPSNGVPYPLLVIAAMLPWNFFTNALSESSGSLIGNANLLTKVYFPRIIVPCSSIIVSLIDFVISLAIMAVMMSGTIISRIGELLHCLCFCCWPFSLLPVRDFGFRL